MAEISKVSPISASPDARTPNRGDLMRQLVVVYAQTASEKLGLV
jgi:hypothetical protein